MNQAMIYLSGLNGLRAIAAMSVLIAHVSQEGIADFGLPKFINLPMAGYGVTLFFVISGFLITYLLTQELKKTTTIKIKNFYVRRILRIWPIYYLFIIICLLAFLYLDQTDQIFVKELWFYIFFAANIPFITHSGIMILVHYWSIGVEEQFYLFWPWIVRLSKSNLLRITIILAVVLLIAKLTVWGIWGSSSIIYRFFMVTRFHCMIIGAIAAILYAYNNRVIVNIISHKATQAISWVLFFSMGFGIVNIPAVIGQELIALASTSMILGQIICNKRLFNLETKFFDFIGKISYGIYVIHPLIIILLSHLFKQLDIDIYLKLLLVYLSVSISTILIAWISYKYYETPFLKLKRRFMIVKSSNSMFNL